MSVENNKYWQYLATIDIAFKYESLSIIVEFINVCRFPPGEGFDYHMHSNYELHYIKKGKGTVIISGREYALEEGDFYLTGPGVVHKQIGDMEDSMVEYALNCSIRMDAFITRETGDAPSELEYVMDILNKKALWVVKDRCGMDGLFEHICEEAYNRKPGYLTEIRNTVIRMIIASARNFSSEQGMEFHAAKRDLNSYRLRIIKSYIADNYNNSIFCEELASHLFLSKRQLNRIVRQQTGYSVSEFVLSEKIVIVKELLKNSRQKLSVIAERTGFSSEFHLSNTFKKWVGISPARYREENPMN